MVKEDTILAKKTDQSRFSLDLKNKTWQEIDARYPNYITIIATELPIILIVGTELHRQLHELCYVRKSSQLCIDYCHWRIIRVTELRPEQFYSNT